MPRARGVLRTARKLTWLRIHCHVYEEHTDKVTTLRINFGESPWQRGTRQGIFFFIHIAQPYFFKNAPGIFVTGVAKFVATPVTL
jgi:hypothetical protein